MIHTVSWREPGDDPSSRRFAEFSDPDDAARFAARLVAQGIEDSTIRIKIN